ncbi:MAG: glycosyltransferase family 39 protein [Deltaproteobacteria bacterium]|nr:glycosyltransferase family 39 protein [Deltaproteobacteria bacterium]
MDETSKDRWALLLVIGVAAGVILPLLGAVGFFDPWETNYGEVARQMVVRDDYLYPFWKEAYFFSKPVLLFWLTAPLYKLVGAGDLEGPMPHSVELLGRLPSALIGILTIVTAYLVARRFWSRRAALLGALALATTPFWAFLSRQAITDMPYVGFTSMAILLLAPTLLLDDDDKAAVRARALPRWFIAIVAVCLLPQLWEVARSGAFLNRVELFGSERALRVVVGVVLCAVGVALLAFLKLRARDLGFHAACLCIALSVLAKGPIGLGLCGLIVIVVVVAVEGPRGLIGLLLHPALVTGAVLFFAIASPWPLVMLYFDGLDEQRKTWFDRFIRYDLLGRVGVGVHGDRGGVEYYVRYAGLGMLPWSGMVPFAIFEAFAALRERFATKDARFTLWIWAWAFVSFCFFAGTTTKFHHYILPFVVPAAMLCGRFLDRLADSSEQAIRVVVVVVGLVSVLFLRDLCAEPWEWIDLFTYHYEGYKPEYYFPVDTLDLVPLPEIGAWKNHPGVSFYRLGPGIAGGVALGLFMLLAFGLQPRPAGQGDLLSRALEVEGAQGRGAVVGAVVAGVIVAVFSVQVFWARAAQHWSQRWLSQTYEEMHKEGEPLLAFQMDWKGETFYSRNREIQVKKNANDLRTAVARPGREFVLVQTDRLDNLKSALGTNSNRLTVVDKSNAKWMLVLVE